MDYAVDEVTGRVIGADTARRTGMYRCPVCHSRAVLRGGNPWAIRRSHFAHVANQARPDCENYHPSSYRPWSATEVQRREVVEREREQAYIRNPELYIAQTSSGFDLQLLVPSCPNDDPWKGQLVVRGRFGEQAYGFASLNNPRRASVPPQLAKYEILRRGDVASSFWAALSEGVHGLRLGATCFRQSEMTGRRLRQGEAMYSGETYLVVLPPGHAPPGAFAEWFSQCGDLAGWTILDLAVPSRVDRLANFEREEIGDWLGHEIRSYASRAYLLNPLPHHLDAFGRFVLPLPIESVDIQLDEGGEDISILDENGIQLDWQEAPDGGISISAAHACVINVFVDRHLTLVLCLGVCEPFSPKGIRLQLKDQEIELFAAQTVLTELRGGRRLVSELTVRASSDHLKDLVKLNGKSVEGENTIEQVLNDLDVPFELDGQNFGRVSFPASIHERPQRLLHRSSLSRAAWLLSLPRPSAQEPVCAMTGTRSTNIPHWVRALQKRYWSVNYAPQVRAMALDLRKGGYE